MTKARHCIATVTSDNYVAGTAVMLHSFMKANSWFAGDIAIIHRELSERWQTYFTEAFERVRIVPVSDDLAERVAAMGRARPDLKGKLPRFYSLEGFRLTGYDRLLICDSDLLFRGSLKELFDRNEPLIACGDGANVNGKARDAASFMPVQPGDGTIFPSFNSGLMLVGPEMTGAAVWQALIEGVTAEAWEGVKTLHTDQIVLNRAFAGRAAIVSGTYNYMLVHRAANAGKQGVTAAEAKVLHYNGRGKPWAFEGMLLAGDREPALIYGAREWFAAYADYLAWLHMVGGTRE